MGINYRTTYEVYIDGVPVCRGKADKCGMALGVTPQTLRHYPYEGHSPDYVKVVPLKTSYDVYKGDDLVFTGGSGEVAEFVGRKPASVIACASTGARCGGYSIKHHIFEEYLLAYDKIDSMLEKAKVKYGKKSKGGNSEKGRL